MAENLFVGGGELGALLRSHDWSQTSLGAVETWSDDLKTAMQIILTQLDRAKPPEKAQLDSDMLQNNSAAEALQQANQLNAFRVKLADALRPLTDASEIQALAARILGESLGANRVIYTEVVPSGEEVIVHVNYTNGVAQLSGRYRLEDYRRNLTIDHQAGLTQVVTNIPNNPQYTDAQKASYREIDIAAHIDVPLIKNNQFVALLAVHQSTPRQWTQTEIKLVEETAERTWAAVELARAEVALRESEQRFRLMADAVPQIVWITDAEGRVEFFNKQWSDYTGVAYEPTTAAQVSANFVHPEDSERTMAAFNEARRTGSIFSVEHRIRSAAGTYRWFLVCAEPYRDLQTGEIVHWFGASIDIHERKQAEQALREREQRLTIATQAAQLGIFEWKVPEDVTIWENDRLYEMFGLTPADGSVSAQEFFNSYLHPDDAEAFRAKFTQAMQTGSLRQTSYRICRKDGTIRWLEVNGQFEFAADGEPLRFVGVNADITARKQAEATIVQRSAQFRQLADAMPQQVWITDAQGNTQYVNQQWTTYTGLTLEQTQDIHYATGAIHPDDFEIASQLWSTALATGTPYEAELRLKHQVDHTYRWFLSRAIAIRDEQGQIVQWFGTSTDIEEFRRAQAQREQLLQREQTAREAAENANRIKDEFLAVLSHELRSPLNPILGWTRLLQNGKLDAARQREALATIERNAKLQTQLIEDLLDISRIMRGKLSLTVAPVSLTFVISAAVETVRLAAEAKNIGIVLDFHPAIAPVSGDAARLQQVVWNLLTNAVKFTPHKGQVSVELRQLDGLAQIRVIDTGKGINPQFLPHVFEYFRQEDGSTTRKFGGLGLGLAIARQIVQMHGGTVQADSHGVGQGATFIVQLPTMQQTSPIAPQPIQTQADAGLPLAGIQILLVDDEPDTREFQAFVLSQSGARVRAVASGFEALQALEQSTPDVLVSDVGMAQMDGYMLIEQIRCLPPHRGGKIRAIALTAYAMDFERQKALQSGFQAHITKPVEPEMLVKAVINVLQQN
ncbi:MAG: PAS domain-containing protein [Mojavia pulchra JT2-VF2]|jgi:PAS domain S-box-containing protein|uniref:Circadian input-output histidine kinase CikA n=1 Tax=Mojavia pulchra JT2-VF2 TaxID=287848 RepID=A0A951UIH7_9NOST|nr:PAS domain-containing protein [Mojavia pulchra JT2-VF2]